MYQLVKVAILMATLGMPWIAGATTTSFTGVNTYNLTGSAASISGSASGVTGSGTGNTAGSWVGNGSETVNVSLANSISAVIDVPLVTAPDQYTDKWTLSVPTGETASIVFTPTNFASPTPFTVNSTNIFSFTGLGAGTYTYNLGGIAAAGAKYVVNTTVSAVPIPAAIWLMGPAVMGLVGFGKRKTGLAA